MTDYPTWARGSMMVDWEHRIDMDRMRRERVEKTQAAMKEKGIDALILWKDENVRYLTSARVIMIQYRSSTTYGVLLRQEGNPTLLASSGEAHRIEECMPWIDDYVPIGILEEPGLVEHTVGTDIKKRFDDWGVSNGTIGLDGHTFTQRAMIEKYFPEATFVDGEQFMYMSRVQKTPDEIACLHQACAIADAVTITALNHAEPGVREFDVAAEAMKTLFTHGGEFGHLASPFVASGEHMAPPTRFPTDKIIRNADIVFIDIGACWNGYFGDLRAREGGGRPAPSHAEEGVYDRLQGAQSGNRKDAPRLHERRLGGGVPGSRALGRLGGQLHQAVHRTRLRHIAQRAALRGRGDARGRERGVRAGDDVRHRAAHFRSGYSGRGWRAHRGSYPHHRG